MPSPLFVNAHGELIRQSLDGAPGVKTAKRFGQLVQRAPRARGEITRLFARNQVFITVDITRIVRARFKRAKEHIHRHGRAVARGVDVL